MEHHKINTCIKTYQDMATNIFYAESIGRFAKIIPKDQRFSPVPSEDTIKGPVIDQLKESAKDREDTPVNFEVAQPRSHRLCEVCVSWHLKSH